MIFGGKIHSRWEVQISSGSCSWNLSRPWNYSFFASNHGSNTKGFPQQTAEKHALQRHQDFCKKKSPCLPGFHLTSAVTSWSSVAWRSDSNLFFRRSETQEHAATFKTRTDERQKSDFELFKWCLFFGRVMQCRVEHCVGRCALGWLR